MGSAPPLPILRFCTPNYDFLRLRSLDGALTDPLAQAGPMHSQTVDRVLVQPERRSVINPFVVRIVIGCQERDAG
jgi:hypothetical protein